MYNKTLLFVAAAALSLAGCQGQSNDKHTTSDNKAIQAKTTIEAPSSVASSSNDSATVDKSKKNDVNKIVPEVPGKVSLPAAPESNADVQTKTEEVIIHPPKRPNNKVNHGKTHNNQ